jgi:integrase/recombinase XerD
MIFNMLTVKYLTPEEITKLFSKIKSDRDRALFGMLYYYGLRCSEASRLKLSDLRMNDGRIFIEASKNGISGEYALSKEARKILLPYIKERLKSTSYSEALFLSKKSVLESGHLDPSQINRLYKQYAKLAKIPEDKRHPHTLRHSIAVHMADSGVPVEHVQIHLRHRKIDSTMVYFQITSQKRHEIQLKALASKGIASIG